MKYFIALLISILFLFSVMHVSYAQSITPEATSTSLTYPIASLGNCSSKTECRTYCNDPVHREACTQFAVKAGIISPTPVLMDEGLTQVMKALGCTSKESCKAFCSESSHYNSCNTIAKKYNVKGGYVVDKTAIASKLMTALNNTSTKVCSSYDTCKAFCDKPENHGKCTEAAKEVGLKGGTELKGPGGCTSVDSCKQYCELHPSECKVTPKITQRTTLSEEQLKSMCGIAVDKRPTVFESGEQYQKLCVTPLPTRVPTQPKNVKGYVSPTRRIELPTIAPATKTDGTILSPTSRIYTPEEKKYYLEHAVITLIPTATPVKLLPTKTPTPAVRVYTPAELQYYLDKTGVTMTPSPTPPRTTIPSPSPTSISTSQLKLSLTPPPNTAGTIPSPTRPPTLLSPTPAVQGVSTERSFWEVVMDYIFVQPS